jgi:hypothetical protein
MDDLEKRIVVLEIQVGRVVSDIESEKGTRGRVNVETFAHLLKLEERVRRLELAIVAMGSALGILQVVLKFIH